MVGTARCAVRAPSGRKIPAALPPGTAQRAVPTDSKADAQRRCPYRFQSGRAAALSLPLIGKLRALAAGEINERPVLRTRRQVFPHWILQNVISLFAATFLVSQPVFEKIALPADARGFSRPFLPFADNQPDWFVGWGKGNQGVNMIGHEQEYMWPPKALFLPVPDRFKECFGDFVGGQLIRSTQFAIDGNEINLPLRIYPQRNLMR
jgi:hypothetical protein